MRGMAVNGENPYNIEPSEVRPCRGRTPLAALLHNSILDDIDHYQENTHLEDDPKMAS